VKNWFNSDCRTQYGSIERIDMTALIQALIMKLGKESILLSLMKMFQNGSEM
jgi:hypothetical protein